MKMPSTTGPLVKDIRTGEGMMEWVIGLGAGLTTVLDPSALPHSWGAPVAAAAMIVKAARRTVLKVVALQKGVGIAAPVPATGELAHVEQVITQDTTTIAKAAPAVIAGILGVLPSIQDEMAAQPPPPPEREPHPPSDGATNRGVVVTDRAAPVSVPPAVPGPTVGPA